MASKDFKKITRKQVQEEEFQFICKNFYPRWRRHNQWTVKFGFRHKWSQGLGFCDREKKIIYLSPELLSKGLDHVRAMLIHEICHAVTRGGHGVEFTRRLEKAAERARELGYDFLSKVIEKDLGVCLELQSGPQGAYEIYGQVEYWVTDKNPPPSLNEVIKTLRKERNFSPDELFEMAPRIQAVYKKAVNKMNAIRKEDFFFKIFTVGPRNYEDAHAAYIEQFGPISMRQFRRNIDKRVAFFKEQGIL